MRRPSSRYPTTHQRIGSSCCTCRRRGRLALSEIRQPRVETHSDYGTLDRSSRRPRRDGQVREDPKGFAPPLVLSRVYWVQPKLVAEITYLTWTADGLLRQTVYVGLREDKPAEQVRRE
jgi:hypothetical protein